MWRMVVEVINGELHEKLQGGYYLPADSACHANEEVGDGLQQHQESKVGRVGDVGLVPESHPHLGGLQRKRMS